MYAPALALLSAALIGIGEFCAHFGLRRVRPLTGVFLGTCYQVLALSVFVAIWGDWDVGARRCFSWSGSSIPAPTSSRC